MSFNIDSLYSSSDLHIDHVRNFNSNGVVVVTFTERSNRDLSSLGFGTAFLIKYGFDVVSVKTNIDVWYENLSPYILEKIKECIKNSKFNYMKTMAYGSSMGAFAAIKFSKYLDVDCVLAISPLFDIKDPAENRWKNDCDNIKSSPMMDFNFISNRTKYCVVYDAKEQDALHLHKYRKLIPSENLSVLSANYSGHPSGPYLKDIGALGDVVFHAFERHCLPRNLANFKLNRMKSNSYLFCLASACLKHGKIKWAESLNSILLSRNSSNAEYHMQLCRIYEKKQNLVRAISACSYASILNPNNVNFAMYRDMLVRKQLKL